MAMKKQFNIAAACFFLLTVLLRGVSVDACTAEDETCDPNNPDCCTGLICHEVSPGVFQCEPEDCEDHEGHSCEPNVRECCEPLECHEVSPGVFQCEPEGCEDHVGHSCSLVEPIRECCEPLECSSTCNTCFNPNCTLKLGDVCNAGGCCEESTVCSTTTNKCVCEKTEGATCDPNACVNECCDLDCVQVSVGVFECQVGGS